MTQYDKIEAYKEIARQLQGGLSKTICASANRWLLNNTNKVKPLPHETMDSYRTRVFPELVTMAPSWRIITGGEKIKHLTKDGKPWFPLQDEYLKERIKWLNKVVKKLSEISE